MSKRTNFIDGFNKPAQLLSDKEFTEKYVNAKREDGMPRSGSSKTLCNTSRLGSLYEKKFEVFCLENSIPIWKPVANQTHEDFIIYYHGFKTVTVKYRSYSARNRIEIRLYSETRRRRNNDYHGSPNEIRSWEFDILALATDRTADWYLIDMEKRRKIDPGRNKVSFYYLDRGNNQGVQIL